MLQEIYLNLKRIPPGIKKADIRPYMVLVIFIPASAFFHFTFIPLFFYLGVKPLALYNVGSVLAWLTAFYVLRKGHLIISASIAFVEVIGFTISCVYFVGWEAGFQLYIIGYLMGIHILKSRYFFKIFWSVIFSSIIVAMYIFSRSASIIYSIEPVMITIIYSMNLVSASFLFAFFGAAMGYSIHWAEKKLEEEHKRANDALVVRNQALMQLDKELAEAADYVRSMLPEPQENNRICTEWKHVPSSSLGGDAFGYHWIDDENFAIYLLDVSGHGVGAALLSASVLNVLRSESLQNTDFKEPAKVLEALNAAFPSDDNNDMFFTFWYCVYNTFDRSLIYASAGHPPALLFTNEQKIIKLKTANFIIGGMPDVSYQQEKHFIGKGASLFIFSDGVYEIKKHNGSMLSVNDYITLLSEYMSDGSKSLEDLYNKTIKISKGQVFEDDYTILRANFL